jgi:hypothetical protein
MALRLRQIADDADLGMPRQAQVRQHRHPAGAVRLDADAVRKHAPQRRGCHARAPDHASAVDAHRLRAHLQGDPHGVDVGHARARAHFHAQRLQLTPGAGRERLRHSLQQPIRAFDEHDAGAARVDSSELARQGAVGDLGQRSGHLDAGGPAVAT